jgi:hypothetical protein
MTPTMTMTIKTTAKRENTVKSKKRKLVAEGKALVDLIPTCNKVVYLLVKSSLRCTRLILRKLM